MPARQTLQGESKLSISKVFKNGFTFNASDDNILQRV
jgi:hypothetical protein